MPNTPRIIDGDTYDKDGRRIRLAGVDTPESTPRSGYQPGGFQATELARHTLGGGFSTGAASGSSYGRDVADVYTPNGQRFADTLLGLGLADTTSWSDSQHDIARIQGVLGDKFREPTYGTPDMPQALADSAERERAQAFQRLASGQFDERILAGGRRDYSSAEIDGRTSRAWDRGTAQLRGQWYGLNDALGQVLGVDAMQQYGRDGMEAAIRDALRNPADIGGLDEVDSLADFAVWAFEAAIEEFPGLALDIGSAAAGYLTGGGAAAAAAYGKSLLRSLGGAHAVGQAGQLMSYGARTGLRGGAAASMYMQQTGGAQMDMVGHGIEDRGDRALWLGGINTAINYTAFMNILGDISRRFKAGEAVDSLSQSFGSALMKIGGESARGMVHGTGQEGVAGLLETLVLELNKAHLDPSYDVNELSLLEGFLKGGVVGGTMGGVGGAAGGTYQAFSGIDRGANGGPAPDEGVLPTVPEAGDLPRRTWTTPEDPASLAAQVVDRPDGVVHIAQANAEDGVTLPRLREQLPGLHERALPDGSVQVAQSAEALAAAPTDPDEAAQAAALGYVQSKDEVAAAVEAGEQALVVQEQDAEGNDLRTQLVSESRVEDALAQAQAAGRQAVVMTPEHAQQRRAERYAEQLAVLGGVAVAQQPDATQVIEDDLPPAALRFEETAPLTDVMPLAEEAGALGIDPAHFVRSEPEVDADVLRRELASRMSETLADDANRTLRDALGGRHLSDLDADQLRQLARAMGMRELPRPLKQVDGNRDRYRQTALAAINRKLNEWRRGMRQDTDGKWLDARAPSDVSLMSQLFPELAGLSRANFPNTREGSAQYQQAVRQAIPDAPAVLQRLKQMDDAELYQAVQLTRADFKAPDGVSLTFGDEERVDVGRLSRAVAEHRAKGEGSSHDTRSEAQVRTLERQLELDTTPDAERIGDPFLADDAAQAAAVAAAYATLTGMTDGPGVRQAVQAQRGVLSDEQAAAVTATAMDGERLVQRVIGNEGRREWEQLAMTSPASFAREFGAALIDTGVPLEAFVASRDTDRAPRSESGEPTAQGTNDRGLVEGRDPSEPGGMDYTGIETGNEQESSDRLFFISLLEGARFARNEEGDVRPAGPLRPESDASLHRRRVTSAERTQRLEGRNLGSLTVRNRHGAEEPWLFDMVALANHAQGGEGRPTNAVEAYRNLLENLSRMVMGPESAAHLPDGENPSYVQTLRSDFAVNEPVVIFEDADGNAVTFGEARDAHYRALADTTEASQLATEADRLREVQAERRKAMRVLINRALHGLDTLEGERRLATILAINDAMYQAYDGDQLAAPFVRFTQRLSAAEVAAVRQEAMTRLEGSQDATGLNQQLEQMRAEHAQVEQALAAAERNLAAERRHANNEHRVELAAFEVIELSERKHHIELLVDRAAMQQRLYQEALDNTPETQMEKRGEPLDLRGVNRYLANLSRFRLTDLERQRHGIGDTGGLDNLETLRTQYRRTREQLTSMTESLKRYTDHNPRLPAEGDPQVDSLARAFRLDGLDHDEAYALALDLAEKVDGVSRKEDAGTLSLDERGDPNAPDYEGATPDESGTERAWQEAQKPIKQRDEQLAAKVEAFKAMHADNPQVNMASLPNARLFQLYQGIIDSPMAGAFNRLLSRQGEALYRGFGLDDGPVTPAHAASREQQAAARRVQAAGIPLPETPRATILDKVFGRKGFRVVGAFDDGAVGDFVSQALADFRSTDRPVLVMVGENAASISQYIEQNQLLKANQRKRASRALHDAGAGTQALYMPMGDFVLVSLPEQPSTKWQAANLRWYHQLGHELGHLVFDDYAQSLAGNRTLRDRIFAAFEAETGLPPQQSDDSLFKEWFADKAANEMIAQAFGKADPEQVTPFTRLAQLMQGLWERVQHLLPRYTRSRSFAQFAEAIRQGQVAKNRLAATPDFTVEHYEGDQGEANRLRMSGTRLKAAVKRATAKGTAMEAASRTFRTVVGRLEGYHPELAKRLFQRSAADRSEKGVAAWQQLTNSSRDRWVGAMERAFRVVQAGAKGRKERDAALTQAFRDLEAGRRTQGAQALATLIDGVIADARKNGLRSVIHRDNFVPVAINHEAVDSRREEFTALLKQAFPQESDVDLRQRLEVMLDTNGFSEYAIAPGVPVSTHDTSSTLTDVIGTAKLRELGFLNEHSDAVLYHWIEGLAKRTAWEANFGGYTREVTSPLQEHNRLLGADDPQGTRMRELGLLGENGLYYDPSGEFKQLVAEAVAEHGVAAEQDIRDMLDGVMGRTTSRMPRGIRQTNDWVTAWTGWTVLLFSGIASIPELGLPMVRAHGRVGVFDGLKGVAEARRLAKDMGVVLSDGAERIIWQSMGDAYESSTLNKLGNAFFTVNGQRMMTNAARTLGVSFGIQYLLKSADVGDSQALAQLGVNAAEVRAWDAAGRPAWQPGVMTADNAIAEKVNAAINQFVYEGSSMPSKLQNPSWFNNPYLKMFWMIKRYMYAYGEGILLGMWRQGKRQWMRGQGLNAEQRVFLAVAPALTFAVATMPLAMAGTELREWLRPYTTGRRGKDVEDYGGARQYAEYLFSRTGGYGPFEALLSMRQQSEWGYSPLGSVSPVIGKMEMLMDWGKDGQLSAGEALTKTRQLLPVLSQTPRLWNAGLDAITR